MKNSQGGSAKVVKRDGSVELFQFVKLKRALSAGMKTCQYDERYADALARAVAIHVQEWNEPRPPTTEYVFHCVREVLRETGLEDVAREIVRYRRTRSLMRKHLEVVDTRRTGRPQKPWSKAVVTQTLVRRYELRTEVARILAGEIERRVLSLKYSVISTALVAEMIRNELMAWGLLEEAVPVVSASRGEDAATAQRTGKEH